MSLRIRSTIMTKNATNNEDLVWYLSYGSNMLFERFMHYIRGGSFRKGGACHAPCADQSEPRRKACCRIPYDMYFAMNSEKWHGAVSFLDTSHEGEALGVAYLVTRQQFDHVVQEENGGGLPVNNTGWYRKVLSLGYLDGYEVVTFTNPKTLESNEPSEDYLETLARGLRENYTEMSEEEIWAYLERCKNN